VEVTISRIIFCNRLSRSLTAVSARRLLSASDVQAAAFASLNGVGLALVLPCVQSVLADVYAPERRGLAFGLVLTTGAVGEPCLVQFLVMEYGATQNLYATISCTVPLYVSQELSLSSAEPCVQDK